MNFTLWFWIINSVTAAIRLLIGSRIGLSGDEAHYWVYGTHPELSYFDHPPAIGYIIKFFTAIFGSTEFGVRFPAVLFFFLLSWIFYKLVSEMYGEKTAFWGTVMLNLTPVFSFLGAVMSIPDSPLSLIWMVFLLVFWKLAKEGKASYWYYLGILLGIGLLCKYNAIFLVASVFLFLLFSPKHRYWFKRLEPYTALLIAFVIFLPVIFWNLENNFASFGFQLKHGFGKAAPHLRLDLLGRCLGAQAGYISPIIFIVSWVILVLSVKNWFKEKDEKVLLILAFSLPSLLLFNAIASFNEILPHWPALGYLVLLIAVADYSVRFWDKLLFRSIIIMGWVVGFFIVALVPLQAMYKVIPVEKLMPKQEAYKIEDGIMKCEKVDVTNDLYGWKEVGKRIDEIIVKAPVSRPKPFVFTHRHYIASQLSFYIPSHPMVYALSERVDAYDFWQRDLKDLDGRDGIFVCDEYFYTEPETIYPFKSWKTLEPVEYFRNNRKVRIFWLTYGKQFNLSKLPFEYTSELAGPKTTLMQSIRNLDYSIFWAVNRKMSNRAFDFAMGEWSRLDAKINVNTGMVVLVIVVGIYLWKTSRKTFWKEFLIFAGILIAGGIIVSLIKTFAGRVRPLTLYGDQVKSFGEHLYGSSFPSGHSETAFSIATYMAYKVKKLPWIIIFFIIAAFVGVSRIYVGVHFPMDVASSAFIGIVFTIIAVKLLKLEKN